MLPAYIKEINAAPHPNPFLEGEGKEAGTVFQPVVIQRSKLFV